MRSSLGIGNSMALSGRNGSPIRTRANNRAEDRCASALPGILDVLPTQHDPEDRHIVACPTSLDPDGYGRSEERRDGNARVSSVDLGGRSLIKKKTTLKYTAT